MQDTLNVYRLSLHGGYQTYVFGNSKDEAIELWLKMDTLSGLPNTRSMIRKIEKVRHYPR